VTADAPADAREHRPTLRGWSHAVAAPVALVFTVALAARTIDNGPRLASMVLYGLSLVLMYAWSAAYHIVTWPPDRRLLMRQVDHANIYLVIAGTSTAVGANVLGGWERLLVLTAIWVFAICGMFTTVFSARLPSGVRVSLYLAVGLIGFVTVPSLLTVLPLAAVAGLVAGGLLYAVGGAVYSLRRPDPFPLVFGYHEVFHILVLAAGAAFALVVWFWVVPFRPG
jgi:hemolysin III